MAAIGVRRKPERTAGERGKVYASEYGHQLERIALAKAELVQLSRCLTVPPHSWHPLLLPLPDHSGSMLPDTQPALPDTPLA